MPAEDGTLSRIVAIGLEALGAGAGAGAMFGANVDPKTAVVAASIQSHVHKYLNSFDPTTSVNRLEFQWEGAMYSATAGLIVVED
jgi:hypothetical protein